MSGALPGSTTPAAAPRPKRRFAALWRRHPVSIYLSLQTRTGWAPRSCPEQTLLPPFGRVFMGTVEDQLQPVEPLTLGVD